MSILILEKNRVIKDGLREIPLMELNVSDFDLKITSIQAIAMADCVIVVDSFADIPQFVNFKDRTSDGGKHCYPLYDLQTFVADQITNSIMTRVY
jgi:hypothetical protein